MSVAGAAVREDSLRLGDALDAAAPLHDDSALACNAPPEDAEGVPLEVEEVEDSTEEAVADTVAQLSELHTTNQPDVTVWGQRGNLTATQAEALAALLKQSLVQPCAEEEALRLLRARGFNVARALALQNSCREWFAQKRPQLAAARSAVQSHVVERHLVTWTPVLSNNGHPVLAVDCSQHRAGDHTALPVFILCVDRVLEHSLSGELTVLFDVRKFRRANLDVKLALELVKSLNCGYPERLGNAYILGAPRVFVALWRIVRVALDVRTRAKVGFVQTTHELISRVGAQAVPTWLGGSDFGLEAHLHAFCAGTHMYMTPD